MQTIPVECNQCGWQGELFLADDHTHNEIWECNPHGHHNEWIGPDGKNTPQIPTPPHEVDFHVVDMDEAVGQAQIG